MKFIDRLLNTTLWFAFIGTLVACTPQQAPQKTQPPSEEITTAPKDTIKAPARKDGIQDIKIPDGGRMTGLQENGERQGPWTSYFGNGTIRSKTVYINGKQNGLNEVFHDNGMLFYSGQYKLDLKIGEWRFYDRKGVLIKTAKFDSLGVELK